MNRISAPTITLTSGLLLLDKPKGLTSHQAVSRVRRLVGQREVGHTGTLDPMASGLLVMTLGRATRLGRFIENMDKVYEGSLILGRATSTLDTEGVVTEEKPVGFISDEAMASACRSLMGEIEQEVPAYSAVKVGGERLYQKARRGDVPVLPKRHITVYDLRITSVALPQIDFVTHVSKGTYVRVLAAQIGAQLGLPAHLCRLRRTRVGRFDLNSALTLQEQNEPQRVLPSEMISMTDAVSHLPSISVRGEALTAVLHGRPLCLASRPDVTWTTPGEDLAAVAVLCAETQALLAVAQFVAAEQRLRYHCVLAGPESARGC